jgi:dipeptidase D
MNKDIANLDPKSIWKNFHLLTQVPRPSKKEEKIRAFMVDWAKERNLDVMVDEIGNVIISKAATPGMEDRKGIILQGHLDMVPQKNSDKEHDFEKDPIEAYIDGDWVTANGTTLGADNGMGVAAAMAVLESNDLKHGYIEALMTIDEETGMTGAENLQPGILKGDILLNLDSEDEGDLYIGCAGGVDTNVTFNYSTQRADEGKTAFKVVVKGLKGGHSGLDIHLDKGNAIKIMTQVLSGAEKYGLQLADIHVGNMRNAIPREGFAIVMIDQDKENDFLHYINSIDIREKDRLQSVEPTLSITAEKTEHLGGVMDSSTQSHLFEALANCPNGVKRYSTDMPDVVETSSNLSIINSGSGKIKIALLTRSAIDAERDLMAHEIAENFRKHGAAASHSGAYPGWKPNVESPILSAMKDAYNTQFGVVPAVKVIHAGLECGILGAIYPNWDMISFGPTIRHPHSPDEKVEIASVGKFWDFLVQTLENAPKKDIV